MTRPQVLKMPDEEANQWAYAIDAALKGERTTYQYDTWCKARHDFLLVSSILDEIGLLCTKYLRQGEAEIRIETGSLRFLARNEP